MNNISPLRYPGGKAKFSKLLEKIIEQLDSPVKTFIEPFCGGAGAALELLAHNKVNSIALNDIDPMVCAFWRIVFGKSGQPEHQCQFDFQWLLDSIMETPVTMEHWDLQKALKPSNMREMAFKFIFLNRTSFNGIVHRAGPIGGRKQIGTNKIDCRFNPIKICKQLAFLWNLRDRVKSVENESWKTFIGKFTKKSDLIYFDPPYFYKANLLYGHYFDTDAHKELRDHLQELNNQPWLLSYDDAKEIRDFYSSFESNGMVIDKTYSTSNNNGTGYIGREIIYSNFHQNHQSEITMNKHKTISVVGSIKDVASIQQKRMFECR